MRRIVLRCLCLLPLAAGLATAGQPATTPGGVATLEERLKDGLLVREPRDVAFIEHVAALVRAGRLPEKVVDSTYLWAITRGRRYPFPAFQRALRIQADRLGVRL